MRDWAPRQRAYVVTGPSTRQRRAAPCSPSLPDARRVSSQYQGVSFRPGRYDAAIVHQGKRLYLGRFDTEEEAAIERDKKARELHGKNAKLNFPDD